MLKVAITGNIASGKSVLENYLQELGYKVFDTDKIAHEILENNSEIKQIFGTLDRKEIAKIVFSNKDKLRQLESIIHPKVKKEILKIFDLNEKLAFISVPQLFETGFDELFDKIIFISADKDIRLKRLMKRNNLSEDEALQRINAQVDENEKILKSNFVIYNNGEIKNLKEKILDLLNELSV